LSLVKLYKGGAIMTDTCDKARKETQLLAQAISEFAIAAGISKDWITIFELDCWHHLHNVWFGAVITDQSKWLVEELEDYFADIPPNLRIHTDVIALLRAVEKECAKTANYAKGHGDAFHHWMRTYHPNSYLYPFARACGGSRQDIGLEGCPAVLMNLQYLVAFFMDQLCSSPDNLLQKLLFVMLQSVHFIALL
jgi:hypothetical protein